METLINIQDHHTLEYTSNVDKTFAKELNLK